jgi:hypothetical protein
VAENVIKVCHALSEEDRRKTLIACARRKSQNQKSFENWLQSAHNRAEARRALVDNPQLLDDLTNRLALGNLDLGCTQLPDDLLRLKPLLGYPEISLSKTQSGLNSNIRAGSSFVGQVSVESTPSLAAAGALLSALTRRLRPRNRRSGRWNYSLCEVWPRLGNLTDGPCGWNHALQHILRFITIRHDGSPYGFISYRRVLMVEVAVVALLSVSRAALDRF